MLKQDLLIEIGTEELPPKALASLSRAFSAELGKLLEDAHLAHGEISPFATPRRLALIISALEAKQADTEVERLGPALQAAFDKDGNPTKAAEGFARSCGVSVTELAQKQDGKVTKLLFKAQKPGLKTSDLLPDMLNAALAKLPIPKRMRWGSARVEFVRPVHWAVLLFGDELIPANILGVETGQHTYGHRFHHPDKILLSKPADYENKLSGEGYVIASFDKRREKIRQQILAEGKTLNADAVIDEALLDEVTALVEWPVALTGSFDRDFLSVPKEALVSSMKVHQKCFYLENRQGDILPNFITLSNLESKDPAQVIHGNERVIRPRLADAAFFFEQDKKQTLASLREKLKTVVFQQQLGTLYEKSQRVENLASYIAPTLEADAALCQRAAQLGKCDLLTNMVYEFAELQGIMGYYYALHDGEAEEVALALNEQYMPRFSGDDLPQSKTGLTLALAERIDTMVGLFAIGQPPTGSKDPFALRRAALGILRILVEKGLSLNLQKCVTAALENYAFLSPSDNVTQEVLDFIFERFRAWYTDRGIPATIFLAVDAVRSNDPLDFDFRIKAVDRFSHLPEAQALAAANKRVGNILAKENIRSDAGKPIDQSLLEEKAELALAANLADKLTLVTPMFERREYTSVLESLSSLQADVDRFFDEVMVNTDNPAVRNNRLALLQQLRQLFLQVADISLLQA